MNTLGFKNIPEIHEQCLRFIDVLGSKRFAQFVFHVVEIAAQNSVGRIFHLSPALICMLVKKFP